MTYHAKLRVNFIITLSKCPQVSLPEVDPREKEHCDRNEIKRELIILTMLIILLN